LKIKQWYFPFYSEDLRLGQPGNGCLLRGKSDQHPSPPG
jgi:hypothetical protein